MNAFQNAVQSTSDIADGYMPGLQALGSHSSKIKASKTKYLGGSVNIDECTRTLYPQANRWDYAFYYKQETYFVEVHPANTGEVKTVLAKLAWLKDWLSKKAPKLEDIKAKITPYVWLPTESGVHITKGSKEYKQLAQSGVSLKKIFILQ
jgi:hypothetical protein